MGTCFDSMSKNFSSQYKHNASKYPCEIYRWICKRSEKEALESNVPQSSEIGQFPATHLMISRSTSMGIAGLFWESLLEVKCVVFPRRRQTIDQLNLIARLHTDCCQRKAATLLRPRVSNRRPRGPLYLHILDQLISKHCRSQITTQIVWIRCVGGGKRQKNVDQSPMWAPVLWRPRWSVLQGSSNFAVLFFNIACNIAKIADTLRHHPSNWMCRLKSRRCFARLENIRIQAGLRPHVNGFIIFWGKRTTT